MLGTTIHSHYKIIKFLGMGRSGSTYLAHNLDLPDCPPCLVKKFQCPDAPLMAEPLIGKLFEAQAVVLQKIGQHPQIPTLLAKFEDDGGRYLVSEYINGHLLSDEFATGSIWTQTQVFDFLMDLVDVLGFLHKLKYIHQDINPKNIIRRKDDGRFTPIGFSAIEELGSVWHQSKHDPRYVNISIGTPGYIPAEQEQNKSQFNSDLYAVGVIAIQALTGEFPLLKDPRTHQFQWRDGVKIDLRLMSIIDKMVCHEYRHRYQSAAEVLQELEIFALTQIPATRFDRLKPHLIFGSITCTLLFSFGMIKSLLTLPDPPSSLAPAKIVTGEKSAVVNSQVDWQNYTDPATKFRLKYPPTWQLEEIRNSATGETVAFFSPKQSLTDNYLESISVRVEKLSDPQMTLAEYGKLKIAQINKSYKDPKTIESSWILFAKRPANLLIYTGIDKNLLPIENLEAWTIDRGQLYTITYKAEREQYAEFLQAVMKTIDSFELE